jgi:HEAT repeat protein
MKLIGLSAANDVSSRIQLMTSVLRLFGNRDAFECCVPFTKHADYYVRWYVMRELISINSERAWPIVKDMAKNDPNLDVRRTAARTLEMFSNAMVAS